MAELTDLSFEQWIDFVFDHPVTTDPKWYWSDNADDWDGPPTTIVAYLTRLFANPLETLSPFSDEQAGIGLYYVLSNGLSDYMFSVRDETVPWADRQACIRSMLHLFSHYFAVKCAPADTSELGNVCGMWWDIFPTWGHPDDPDCAEEDHECLDVLSQILYIDSNACVESALHGLGHWHLFYPSETERIIDEFLEAKGSLHPSLRQYALSARAGAVL